MRTHGVRSGRLATVLIIAAFVSVGVIAASAKVKHGGPGPDRITGSAGPDVLRGGRGKDVLRGRGGRDRLIGGKHSDRLIGGRGRDRLIGGKHGDRMIGGPGRDEINMRNGAQIASPGNDRIRARDGTPDQINCGDGGGDVAIVDAVEEGVYDCEKLKAPKVEGENIG